MLTRLQVNGFKNLLGLDVSFGPFSCIAGPNGSGKSNVFDAIHFLSLLADSTIMEAAEHVRSSERGFGDPRLLFFTDGERRMDTISLAAEMIVPGEVKDDFSRPAKPTSTFLRYELELAYEEPSKTNPVGRVVLKKEHLGYIQKGEAHKHLRWKHSKTAFRDAIVHSHRRGQAFIETEEDGGVRIIRIHQDTGRGGQPRPAPAESAPRTVIATSVTASDPTILAARREMQSWRLLALEPSAMRSPDKFLTAPYVSSNGAHLAATLFRLAMTRQTGAEEDPERVYSEIASRLSQLINVAGIKIEKDDKRDLLTLMLLQPGGTFLPASSLSDGILRFLALSILHSDPAVTGLLCMEEPENGIHPEKMGAMVDLVRGLAVDPEATPGDDNPLRQILVNTHSPYFVQLQNPNDLLFAKTAMVRGPGGKPVQTLRLLPLQGTWRADIQGGGVSRAEVLAYLVHPPGAQLSLDGEQGEGH